MERSLDHENGNESHVNPHMKKLMTAYKYETFFCEINQSFALNGT